MPLLDVPWMHASDRLDYRLTCEIFKAGFSRIPVFDDEDGKLVCAGVLFAKDLVLVSPSVRVLTTVPGVFGRVSILHFSG